MAQFDLGVSGVSELNFTGEIKMNKNPLTQALFELKDEKYRLFQAKLVPNIPAEKIIGVRAPVLRAYAKKAAKIPEAMLFLQELPHFYYDENNLHGELLLLLYKNDIRQFLAELERFLPYVDNWATCDMLSPKIFKKNLPLVYEKVKGWLKSEKTYTVRFGIVTLLGFFLDDAFKSEMLQLVADVKSDEFYVKMAAAWYFSVALVKQYDAALPYFQNNLLDPWTHNKAIQKALESRRIPAEIKEYLKSLKVKARN